MTEDKRHVIDMLKEEDKRPHHRQKVVVNYARLWVKLEKIIEDQALRQKVLTAVKEFLEGK